jgi:hypothetical protein
MEDLELALSLIQKKEANSDLAHQWVTETWESFYVVRTGEGEGDIALSRPAHTKNLGIYFQPRAGQGGPVILLGLTTEIYRVEM